MGKSIGIHELLKKEYVLLPLSPEWIKVVGHVERGFSMLVFGPPGAGKTTFVGQFCKALSQLGRVYYNSIEQGESRSFQQMAEHVRLNECGPGRFMVGNRDSYGDMTEKLRRNRAQFVVIDSAQFMGLTLKQYREITTRFPKKSFIIVSWGSGERPDGKACRDIEYRVDIKCRVVAQVARCQSRFGLTEPHRVFEPRVEGLFT